MAPSSDSSRRPASSTAAKSAMSSGRASARRPAARTSSAAASNPPHPRASRPTSYPRSAKARTVARPTPADAPVTTTTLATHASVVVGLPTRRFPARGAAKRGAQRLPRRVTVTVMGGLSTLWPRPSKARDRSVYVPFATEATDRAAAGRARGARIRDVLDHGRAIAGAKPGVRLGSTVTCNVPAVGWMPATAGTSVNVPSVRATAAHATTRPKTFWRPRPRHKRAPLAQCLFGRADPTVLTQCGLSWRFAGHRSVGVLSMTTGSRHAAYEADRHLEEERRVG